MEVERMQSRQIKKKEKRQKNLWKIEERTSGKTVENNSRSLYY